MPITSVTEPSGLKETNCSRKKFIAIQEVRAILSLEFEENSQLLAQAEAAKEQLRREKVQLEQRLRQLEEAVPTAISSSNEAQKHLQKAEGQIRLLLQTRDQLLGENHRLEQEMAATKRKFSGKTEEREKTTERLKSLQDEIETKGHAAKAFSNRSAYYEEEIAALKKQLPELRNFEEFSNTVLKQLEDQCLDLEDKLQKAKKSLTYREEDASEAQGKLKKFQAEFDMQAGAFLDRLALLFSKAYGKILCLKAPRIQRNPCLPNTKQIGVVAEEKEAKLAKRLSRSSTV